MTALFGQIPGRVDPAAAPSAQSPASLAVSSDVLALRRRQALTMRLRDNLKQTEIAEQLNCSQMQVSRLLRRASTRLHELTDPDSTPPVTSSQSTPPR